MYALSLSAGGKPSLWPFLFLLSLVLVGHNVLFPNLSAAAMQPVGHVAGTAAAIFATWITGLLSADTLEEMLPMFAARDRFHLTMSALTMALAFPALACAPKAPSWPSAPTSTKR